MFLTLMQSTARLIYASIHCQPIAATVHPRAPAPVSEQPLPGSRARLAATHRTAGPEGEGL